MMDKQHEMRAGTQGNMFPEKYDKETFIEELKKSTDPDKMSWMMLNFLVQKMADDMQVNGETSRYSGAMYSDSGMKSVRRGYNRRFEHEYESGDYPERGGSYRHQSYGYARHSSDQQLDEAKEKIGEALGRRLDENELKCLIVKEAASLIKKLSECEDYEALKEFNELCLAMKGYAYALPEELEIQAKHEAIEGYARMFVGERAFRERDSIGYDGLERKGERGGEWRLPTVEVDEFGRRGRHRDSMGRFK